jgi:hypothetical protein
MTRSLALRGQVERLFRSDFPRFQGLWVEQHLRLMLALRRHVGNDLDKIIILSAIGQQQLGDPGRQQRAYAPSAQGEPPDHSGRFTNIDRIAAATGIPRESVRRKVNELIKVGWVVRTGSRALAVHPRAAVDMQPATETVFDMLDRLFAEFAAALAERGDVRIARVGVRVEPQSGEDEDES